MGPRFHTDRHSPSTQPQLAPGAFAKELTEAIEKQLLALKAIELVSNIQSIQKLVREAVLAAVQKDRITMMQAANDDLHQHPLFYPTLHEMVNMLTVRIWKAIEADDLENALRDLILASECSRYLEQIPVELARAFSVIDTKLDSETKSEPHDLFVRAKRLFSVALADEGIQSWPHSFSDFDTVDIELCPYQVLVAYARQAREDGQLAFAVLFQEELVKRKPDRVTGLIILARLYEETGQLQKALDIRIRIQEFTPDDINNADYIRRLQHPLHTPAMPAAQSQEPSPRQGRLTLYPTTIPTLSMGRLIAESQAAMREEKWDIVVMLQREILRREPKKPAALGALTRALEKIGTPDAIQEAYRICRNEIPEVETNPNSRRQNAARLKRLAGRIAQQRRNEGQAPIDVSK